MATTLKYMPHLLAFVLILFLVKTGEAQMAKMSFSNAYNMINSGSKSAVSSSGGGSAMMSVSQANYSHAVKVGYGIPLEIGIEYAVVKANLSSEIASYPDNYNNSAGDVQQAFSNLAYGDFVKISDYNTVNVVLNFRFNPPLLKIYGNVEEEFLNNSNSSPYDPMVYKMPATPVRGTKIMIIKK